MKIGFFVLLAALALVLHPDSSPAQQPSAPRSFELGALQLAAIQTDPRLRQLELLMTQTEQRLRNIAAARLPSIAVEGQAQYQSDVPKVPFVLPDGRPLFSPAKATFDSGIRLDQRVFDATIPAQAALERAQLAEQQARVRTALFNLRQQVNEAFFAAAALQARAGALGALIADLEGRLKETNARVNQGAALSSDAAAIEATLLQRRQDEEELRSNRRAALARLAIQVGQPIRDDDRLALPDLASAVAETRRRAADVRARPEFEQFARSRERLAKQVDLTMAQERPRVSTFAKMAYGRPGLNFIDDRFDSYGLAGVRVQWNAWTWGTPAREREALAIQQQIVASDEAAFARTLVESTESDLAAIDRLQTVLALDERIVILRDQVVGSTGLRLQEGVVTASEYLDRQAELLQARFAQAGHQVDLAHASARLLTTLGLQVQ
jgi:outer membrane protein TolC